MVSADDEELRVSEVSNSFSFVVKDVHRLKHTQVCEKTHDGEPTGAGLFSNVAMRPTTSSA